MKSVELEGGGAVTGVLCAYDFREAEVILYHVMNNHGTPITSVRC